MRWESERSDVGREVRLSHRVNLSEVSLDRFPILDGNGKSLEHPLKSSEVRFDKVPIVEGNDTRLEHLLKSSEVRLERFPRLSGNVSRLGHLFKLSDVRVEIPNTRGQRLKKFRVSHSQRTQCTHISNP